MKMVDDFLKMLDRWHAAPEVWDNELERQIAAMKYDILRNPRKLDWGPRGTRFFSPSGVDSCRRELYMKMIGAERDRREIQPHQGRWTRLGTLFGDMLQKDLLFIEKHYERVVGEPPPFTVEREEVNGRRYPKWERFAEKIKRIDHRGHEIAIKGQPDGILRYKDGTRVGIEIKSKQTTPARTGQYSMRGPEESHAKQVVAYSILYGVDDYLIVYGNLAKKSWNMSDEDYEKYPDIRAFHVHISESDRLALLDDLADVMEAVKSKTPPPLDLARWAFNNYKTACAKSLTDAELREIKSKVKRVQRSGVGARMKRSYMEALNEIEAIREG